MKLTEGGKTYPTNWRKVGDEYEVRLVSDPRLRAVADNLDDASDKLAFLVCEKTGDGEACIELIPPRPTERRVAMSLELVVPAYNASAVLRNKEDLFIGKPCPVCWHRTRNLNVSACVERLPSADIFGFDNFPVGGGKVYSSRLLDSIDATYLAEMRFLPVKSMRKSKLEFLELVGGNMIGTVAVSGMPLSSGFITSYECGSCGRREFEVNFCDEYSRNYDVIAARDFERSGRPVFGVSSPKTGPQLVMTRPFYTDWRKNHPELRGISSDRRMAIAKAGCEIRSPVLPIVKSTEELQALIQQGLKKKRNA